MAVESKEWTPSPGSVNRQDEMNHSTTQKSVDGVVMQALLRSSLLRLNVKEERFCARTDSEQSATSSVSFRSDQSKDHNPIFKGQSSLKSSATGRIDFEEHSPPSPVQQRPDYAKVMVPEEINGSGLESGHRIHVRSDEKRINFKEQSPPRSAERRIDFEEQSPTRASGRSTTSSVSFKSDWSKNHNPNFKGQSSPKVPLDNQHSASTESDGRDDPTEEFRERKFSFKKMLRDSFRRLLRRVSKNNMEM